MTLGTDVGLVAAFAGGVLALLSPCGALLLPSFFAYAFDDPGRLLGRTGVFYLGLVSTLVPLGVTASAATQFVRANQNTVLLVAGVVVVMFGVATAFGRGFALLPERLRAGHAEGNGPVAVYLLGLAYGLTGFCTGPILGSVLVIAAVGGRPVLGGVLLAVYALGMVVPLLALALVWERLGDRARAWLRGREVRVAGRSLHSTSLVSGLLLVVVGVLLVTGASVVESQSLALLGARVEEWATEAGARVPDEALAVGALVGSGVWLAVRWRQSGR